MHVRASGLPVRTLALAWLALGASTAGAQDRPLQTEAATTATARTLVLETGFDVIGAEPSYLSGVERTAWAGPALRLVYSPADAVELDVEWVARVGVLGGGEGGGVASSDFGDIALRAKWRFRESSAGTTLGARFGVFLPQTSFEDVQHRPLGLGPNTLRAFVELLATRPAGDVRVHLNGGVFLFDEVGRPHDQRDFLAYGIAVEWPLARPLAFVAEIAGRAGDGAPGADARGELRAGFRLGRGRLRADAAVRRGLAAADGEWGATAGLTLSLRR